MAASHLRGPLKQTLQRALLRAWTARGPVAMLLLPAALAVQALSWLRRQLYACGLLRSWHTPAVVIVVGNVVVGGAGKTPTVIAVVQHLQGRKYRVGVISRGYGRAGSSCLEVEANSHPGEVGDEPLLIRRRTLAPVFVASTRLAAATALLARYPETQILVCDDGLQHYALYRDVEICVFGDRGCGNGWPMPAGPLREAWPRRGVRSAGQCDDDLLVLHTGEQPAFAGFTADKSLSPVATARDGTQVPLNTLHRHSGKPLAAVAGIAQPESFFAMLRAAGVPLAKAIGLPDHYQFDSDIASKFEGYSLICTEKDAAKLWLIAPDAVSVALEFSPEPAFFEALDAQVTQTLAAKLSSSHGHKTT